MWKEELVYDPEDCFLLFGIHAEKQRTDLCCTSRLRFFLVISAFLLGNMTAHLSSLIHPDRKLFACDVPHETREQIEGKLEKMAARSIL